MQYIMQTEAEQQEFNGSQNSGQISSWKHCKAFKIKEEKPCPLPIVRNDCFFQARTFQNGGMLSMLCWLSYIPAIYITEKHDTRTCKVSYATFRYCECRSWFVLRDHFCLLEWNWFLLKAETHLNLCNLLKSFWRVSWPRVPIHLFINLYVIPILLKACM